MKSIIKIAILFGVIFHKSMADFRIGYPEDDNSMIISSRIISGHDAKPHAAPFIVSIRSAAGKHLCGGSILTKNSILTAAHCLQSDLYVVAGLHDRRIENDGIVQVAKVKGYAGHQDFKGGVSPYDIAILYLEKSLELNDQIQAIALPETAEKQMGEAVLFGWGRIKSNAFNFPNILQTVTSDLMTNQECYNQLPDKKKLELDDSMICLGSRNHGISACNADSGGPLVQQNADKSFVQVGVVSWGVLPCGKLNKPSVFTHTGAHLNWIKRNTKK